MRSKALVAGREMVKQGTRGYEVAETRFDFIAENVDAPDF